MDSNIPSKPAYGVYVLQLVQIGRIYNSYDAKLAPVKHRSQGVHVD